MYPSGFLVRAFEAGRDEAAVHRILHPSFTDHHNVNEITIEHLDACDHYVLGLPGRWALRNFGPIVVPGKYTVKLTVDGQSATQPIEILRDPRVATSVADLDLSVKLQLRLRDDISAAADMVNAIEVMRKQLEDVTKAYREDRTREALLKQVADMDRKLLDVETKILEPAQMTSDDKYFQQAYRVYMNLIWLNGEVGPGAGDVLGGADFPPTDTSVNVMETIEKDLNAAKADYKNLMDRDVPAFNRSIGGAITPLTGGR